MDLISAFLISLSNIFKIYFSYFINPGLSNPNIDQVILIVHIGLMLSGLYIFFMSDSKKRRFEELPTSKIRSAAQGFVELSGKAVQIPGQPTYSKIQRKECIWYCYEVYIEKKIIRDGKNHYEWVRIKKDASTNPILIDDGTGICFLYPYGANTEIKSINSSIIADLKFRNTVDEIIEDLHNPKRTSIFSLFSGPKARFKLVESILEPNTEIYALGNFSTIQVDEVTDSLRSFLLEASKQYIKNNNLNYQVHSKLNILDKTNIPPRQQFFFSNITEEAMVKNLIFYRKLSFGVFVLLLLHNIYATYCLLDLYN